MGVFVLEYGVETFDEIVAVQDNKNNSQKRYDAFIRKLIIDSGQGIKNVLNLQSVKTLLYDHQLLLSAIEALEKQLPLPQSGPQQDSFRQYIDIVSFEESNGKVCFALFYDSDELWQNPELLKIVFRD